MESKRRVSILNHVTKKTIPQKNCTLSKKGYNSNSIYIKRFLTHMQSISSFTNRNGFEKQKVEALIAELDINLISAGSTKMLLKEDAKLLRSHYAKRYLSENSK